MKLSISNLAWPQSEHERVLALLQEHQVTGVEIAPYKLWGDLLNAEDRDVQAFAQTMTAKGFSIPALQAVFGPQTNFRLFDDTSRPHLLTYLRRAIDVAALLGAKVIVFGAPSVRDATGKDPDRCWVVAKEFFSEAGTYAKERGVCVCIEANAREYHCNFITKADEAARLVRDVSSDGFGLHLDAACMTLENDPADVIDRNMDILRHFHVSEPHLASFDAPVSKHREFAEALKRNGYAHWVSIEMLERNPAFEGVQKAVAYASEIYLR